VPHIIVTPVTTARERRQFVTFPWRIYKNDPNWVPPLISEQLARLDPARNPFWQQAEGQMFLAWRNGELAGTVLAFINHAHNQALGERTGFFGFFETVNDRAVAAALLETAADWLCVRGMETIRGPVNLSESEEFGLLVEGFDTRPALLETHTPSYYVELVEELGFRKFSGNIAWEATRAQIAGDLNKLPPKLLRVAERVRRSAGVRVRKADLSQWERELAIARDIYNQALSALEGYVPMSEVEFERFAAYLRPLLDPDLALVAEVLAENGEWQPAGFALALPDVNEALQHLNGRLYPCGWLKLWWYMRHIKTVSFKVLAVIEAYRGRGLETLLILEMAKAVLEKGYQRMDMSLTAESNVMVNRIVERLGGRPYRRYAIYERSLSPRGG